MVTGNDRDSFYSQPVGLPPHALRCGKILASRSTTSLLLLALRVHDSPSFPVPQRRLHRHVPRDATYRLKLKDIDMYRDLGHFKQLKSRVELVMWREQSRPSPQPKLTRRWLRLPNPLRTADHHPEHH